ncbi:MAG: hypothetical protein ACETWR_18230 [Anaerolineae bacterium]
MKRLRKDLWIILLLLFFIEGPLDCFWFFYLDPQLDVDIAQGMANAAFAKRNPGLQPGGGRMLDYDPFAYTVEVQGHKESEGKQVLAKTEVYRVYRWGEVVELPLGALPLFLLRITALFGVIFVVVEIGRWLIPHLKGCFS